MKEPQEIRVAGYCLATLVFAAAVIHFATAARYVEQYWLFGVSTLVIAWVQGLWAIGAAVRPTRPVLRTGAVLNAAVLVLSVVTLATGDAIGAAPRGAGLSGFGDWLGAALEAVAVAGCAWLATAAAGRAQPGRRWLVFAPAAIGGTTSVLLAVALATIGPVSLASTAPVTTIELATASPAGAITMPDPGMQMADGMAMASSTPCTATPTARQQQAAVTMVNTSWRASRKYQSLAAAKAAGYRPITPTGAAVVHYLSPAAYRATILGGPVLDYADPQSLVYANTPDGAVLVAAMYITTPHGQTPQPGGCLTQWHVHTNLCLTKGLGVVGAVGSNGSTCPAGSRNRVTPPMIHVWFVPIPGGPTAVDASDAQVVHAAEQVPAPANGTA